MAVAVAEPEQLCEACRTPAEGWAAGVRLYRWVSGTLAWAQDLSEAMKPLVGKRPAPKDAPYDPDAYMERIKHENGRDGYERNLAELRKALKDVQCCGVLAAQGFEGQTNLMGISPGEPFNGADLDLGPHQPYSAAYRMKVNHAIVALFRLESIIQETAQPKDLYNGASRQPYYGYKDPRNGTA